MSDLNGIAKSVLQSYIVDSNEVLEFKLVRSATDLEDDETTFKPEMTHQIFGESEQIFGYKGLKIKMYFTAAKLAMYLSYNYTDKVSPNQFDDIKPDEVIKPIAEKIPSGYFTNLDDFIGTLSKESFFKPFGEMKHRFQTSADGTERTFEAYLCDVTLPGFLKYHERLQTFILYYIDAASYIDTDDDKWEFFLLYEKYSSNGNTCYAIAGYTTVYKYYAYPSSIRPRISQMLVLPPFQKLGLGSKLLNVITLHYASCSNVLDITVEDPSGNFIRLRDFVDCKNCVSLKSFKKSALLSGFSEDMYKEANKMFKINKRQARRVYEILRLNETNRHDEDEYYLYRLDVKKRLNAPYAKEDRDMKKLRLILKPEEYAACMTITSQEQRQSNLSRQYKELEENYLQVINKLVSLQ